MKEERVQNGKPKEKRRKKRIKKVFIVIPLLVLLLAGIVCGLYFIKVDRITVTGDERVSGEVVLSQTFPDEESTRLYKVIWRMVDGLPQNGAFSKFSLKLTWFTSAVITAWEEESVFKVVNASETYYYTANGIRVDRPETDELIRLEGFPIRNNELYTAPDLKEDRMEAFRNAGMVLTFVNDRKLPAESLTELDGSYLLSFGDVKVSLGSMDHMSEKIYEVSFQYPKYEGLKGTLHMENFDGTNASKGFTFTVDE